MERNKYVIVTAGGTGTRMGSQLPKQFLELEGIPILRRTLECFLRAVPDIHVITVLPEAHLSYWRQYCLRENFTCPQRLVRGGFTRFHSVRNALQYVPDGVLVAVHDGVRPLITPEKVQELFRAAEEAPAVIPVLPVTDTLKVVEKKGGVLVPTGTQIDRSRIYGAQTPRCSSRKVSRPPIPVSTIPCSRTTPRWPNHTEYRSPFWKASGSISKLLLRKICFLLKQSFINPCRCRWYS